MIVSWIYNISLLKSLCDHSHAQNLPFAPGSMGGDVMVCHIVYLRPTKKKQHPTLSQELENMHVPTPDLFIIH